ncbi:MAG: hypothetical protein LLG00_13210 [Planctomycetaceae bacterium]|nr:hypothetical protein [Planctomycetaceae bacterium]
MMDTLQEFCDSRGVTMRVDREKGVIRGVKVLGLESRNGRTYLPEALAEAARLYEDAKVNVNHPRQNPNSPRDYQDRIGTVRNVALRPGQGLFADFHFNPKHALAEQLIWDAEHSPENVGFSHNVEARCARRGDRVVVETITRVQSVDLVADPATTRGLFESAADPLSASESELAAPASSVTTAPTAASVTAGATAGPAVSESRDVDPMAAELDRLREEVARLRSQEAVEHKRGVAQRLLREFGLPDAPGPDARSKTLISPQFMETLLAAEDEVGMRAMVEDRANLVATISSQRLPDVETRPICRDQHTLCAAGMLTTKSFVNAIT